MTTIYRPGQRVDAYEVVRLLGQGGSSRVYMAQDWRTQQSVVLKFPNDEEIGGAAIFARYQREAEIGRRLSHPSIQCHLNQREQRSREYLVLEYLQGHSLRAVMQKQAPDLLPVEHVIQIVLQVGDALVYVHKQGIIHQDIKPDNIFLLDTGHIKLLDFGIATFEETRQKRWRWWLGHSSLIGTPAYMSPERLRNRQGDLHADIYAVGIVLYELLCGRTPFIQDDGFALINQHLSHDPPDIL